MRAIRPARNPIATPLLLGRIGQALPAMATVAAVILAAPAHALQLVEASDGVSVEAILSIKEPTRIRIENEPITDVFGNILSSNCGPSPALPASPGATAPGAGLPVINPGGEIVLECDRDKGEVYIRPVGDSAKPINLFVSSAGATYTLLLRRADTPADTIVIRDKTPKAFKSMGSAQAAAGPSPNPIRAMKALLVAMASDRVPADIQVEEAHRTIQLWTEVRFSLVRQYEGRGLIGEKFVLQNVGTEPMVVAEQEFDRDGADVAGIAIEHHNLRPSESTSVYVIRRGGGR
ncbi:type-F conjugative transfer system secretin TraK [Aromatoleum evansii]|uniref:Type-F conjugative transfer system secretin TraK n=1 Tax=Aromatoleum evansii TaxID=59406 RepID=A0ABZ1AED0_AROEV|nr:type-F conjugative transfer system secretin TraK [Aromatoleum evansii]